MSYFSPVRYSVENFFRIISDENVRPGVKYADRDELLSFYGYTLGYAKCFSALYIIGIVIIFIGYLMILLRNRKL